MTPTHYNIVDRQTKAIVGTAKNLKSATRSVDRRDNAYGGYRFSAQPVYDATELSLFNAVRDALAN